MRKRSGRPQRFAAVPNETIDDAENLDFMALALLTVLIRHRDGWEITLAEIGAKYGYGRDAMANAMGLLQAARYVVKVRMMSAGKNEWSTEVYVYDTPATDVEVEALLAEIERDPAVRRAEVIKPTQGAVEHVAKHRKKIQTKRRQGPSVAVPRVPENPHSGATSGNGASSQVGPECGVPRQSVDPTVSKKTVGEKTRQKIDAPLARSAPDGRRPSDGSSAGTRASGSAASSKSDASRSRLSAAQWRSINEVFGYFPQGIAPPRAPELVQAILAALAEGQPDVRTPAQVGERIRSRWISHGYAQQHADGKIQSVVGVSIDMVRAYKRGDRYGCPDPRCENGADIDTGETCRACEVRIADRLAAKRREQGQAPPGEPSAQSGAPASRPVPAQRPSALAMAECSGRDGICGRPVKNGELCSRCKTDPEHAGAADFEYASAGPAAF